MTAQGAVIPLRVFARRAKPAARRGPRPPDAEAPGPRERLAAYPAAVDVPSVREAWAAADAELAVRVAQVELDRGGGDEQRLRDLAVLRAGGRELGDPALARRQRVGARGRPPARPRAGRPQLAERPVLERARAAAVGDVDRQPQPLARLVRLARAPQRDAQVGVRAGALELRLGAVQGGGRLAQQGDRRRPRHGPWPAARRRPGARRRWDGRARAPRRPGAGPRRARRARAAPRRAASATA